MASTDVETFLAAYFNKPSGWARAYPPKSDAPTPTTNPPLNSSITDTAKLTTDNGVTYWSGVRQFAFTTRSVYAGTIIAASPPAAVRVEHNLSSVLKTTDMLSPMLFDCCNTGYQLKYMVLWQPSLKILITYWNVNITSFQVRGSHAQTASFQFTTDANSALESADEQISTSPLLATGTWEDEVGFTYQAVEFNVKNQMIQSWSVKQSAPIESESSPFANQGTFPS